MLQRYEYRVLITKGEIRSSWYHAQQRLGGWEDLERILNAYAADGWRVVGHAMGIDRSRIILERPFQPAEMLPSPAPAGGAWGLNPVG